MAQYKFVFLLFSSYFIGIATFLLLPLQRIGRLVGFN